ncbi:MAG: PQQ-dependent catabolism-associated CXXCW motif protein [Hyphomicrobium sp.]|nr:PQQ-dependent catabolism-associated CXXCW motif protein [Hyphomicrobium sp.]
MTKVALTRTRPAVATAGRALSIAGCALLLMASQQALATGDFVDPRSITPPAATGEVPEPEDYRTDGYRMPVPKTLKGAVVIDADRAEGLLKEQGAVFIDVYPRAPKPANLPAGTVWRDPAHATIAGTNWMPNVGYGVLSPDFENYFRTRLEALTGNDKSKPIVFFCLKDCWMSWNAAKRAISWGYSSVMWFPEGTDGWQLIGNDLVPATPLP